MQAYRIEMTLQQDGRLTLSNLPFHAGETVEVIVFVQPANVLAGQQYPLRGMPLCYLDPTEVVAQADWEAVQ